MNIIDVILLAVLAVFAAFGAHRGLILTLCGLVVTVLAIFGAQAAADQLAPSVAYLIEPSIHQAVQTRIEDSLPNAEEEVENITWENRGNGFLEQMIGSDYYKKVVEQIQEAVQQEIDQATQGAASAVSQPLAQSVAWLVIYLITFFLIQLAGALIAWALDLAAKLPGLRTANRVLGALAGLLKGAIVLIVLCSLGTIFGLIPQQSIQSSPLLGLFAALGTISL